MIGTPVIKELKLVHENTFACLFSVHNTIGLSCHEQVKYVSLGYVLRDTSPIIGEASLET